MTKRTNEALKKDAKCLVGVFQHHFCNNKQQHSVQQQHATQLDTQQVGDNRQQLKDNSKFQQLKLQKQHTQQQTQQQLKPNLQKDKFPQQLSQQQQPQQLQQPQPQQKSQQQQVTFFRVVLSNINTTFKDLDFVLKEIKKDAEALKI